jgi:hypothetical protein
MDLAAEYLAMKNSHFKTARTHFNVVGVAIEKVGR